MNYAESKIILAEVKKASRILLNCHRDPDPDSFGSALGLYSVLSKMGKNVRIVCPTEVFKETVDFLDNFKKIEHIDFSKLDFSKHDLFIMLDSGSWEMVSDLRDFVPPKIPTVVIDHHLTNSKFGTINLVDVKTTSTAELLYLVLKDWGVKLDGKEATALLTGILADTAAFRYPGSGIRTFKVAQELIALGADKDGAMLHLFSSTDFNLLKGWGELMVNAKLDKENKFYWVAVNFEKYVQMGALPDLKDSFASNFGQVIKGTDFSVTMLEVEPKKLSVSLRSRSGFDCSKIAVSLGGGGHRAASGCRVEGLAFDKAVEKVLKTAKKIANENKS